LTSTAVNWHFY